MSDFKIYDEADMSQAEWEEVTKLLDLIVPQINPDKGKIIFFSTPYLPQKGTDDE